MQTNHYIFQKYLQDYFLHSSWYLRDSNFRLCPWLMVQGVQISVIALQLWSFKDWVKTTNNFKAKILRGKIKRIWFFGSCRIYVYFISKIMPYNLLLLLPKLSQICSPWIVLMMDWGNRWSWKKIGCCLH